MKFFISILLLFYYIAGTSAISSGLYFKAHDYIKENRTSLDLTCEKKFRMNDGLSLSFDVKLREEFHNYGYIFRIICNDSLCFDLISNFNENQRSLALVEGRKIYLSFDQDSLAQYRMGDWSKVEFHYLPKEKEIFISFNGISLKQKTNYEGISNFRIVFGSCDYPNFISSDVPPMTIRNISIKDRNSEEKAYWPLREHSFNEVYDSISYRKAYAKNPIWDIDYHTKWVEKEHFSGSPYMQMTCDEENGILYIADVNYIVRYNLRNNKIDSIRPDSGNIFHERSNQVIYNPYYHQLWAYDFYKPHIIFYDFDKNCWSQSDLQIKNPTHSQHNAYISPLDSMLYTYGGYGTYTYKEDILRKRKEDIDWEPVNYSPHIPARYLSGAGFKSADTLLLFGGYGNPTGKQEMGPINYYDLYAIDIKKFKVEHLWTLPKPKEDFVVGNAIIVDSELNKFFALCYPNNKSNNFLVLKSFDLTDGKSEVLADTIPFIFDDVTSFCTLYYDRQENMLYTVIKYNDTKQNVVNVWSLAYPPLNIKAVNQSVPVLVRYQNQILIFSLFLILGVVTLFMLVKRDKRKKKHNQEKEPATMPQITTKITSITNTSNMEEVNFPALSSSSSINFLGGFHVLNKSGADITGLFTPTVKYVLILIILYTVKNKKGVSNVTFKDLLWSDKSEENSQNNRRVNIRKLKILIEELDGISLTGDNGYWSIKTDERFHCDYVRINELISLIKCNNTLEITDVNEFLNLASYGQLLPYVQEDWCDIFKSEFSSELLNVLIKLLKTPEIQGNYKLIIRIADIIFLHDSTDEYALSLKCKALYENGKSGLAKSTYENFRSEYETLLGSAYPKTFQEIIGNESRG